MAPLLDFFVGTVLVKGGGISTEPWPPRKNYGPSHDNGRRTLVREEHAWYPVPILARFQMGYLPMTQTLARVGGRSRRQGFTMIEALVVVTIIGVGSMIVFPRFGGSLEKANARAARDRLSSMLAMAKSNASLRGQAVSVKLSSNSATITLGTSTVLTSVNFLDSYGVSVTGPAEIAYSSRGFATNLSAAQVYKMTRNNYADSICVSRIGQVAKRCGL
jgi:prepilin-type N-terminal cleavage/methylation domain-containing protein